MEINQLDMEVDDQLDMEVDGALNMKDYRILLQ